MAIPSRTKRSHGNGISILIILHECKKRWRSIVLLSRGPVILRKVLTETEKQGVDDHLNQTINTFKSIESTHLIYREDTVSNEVAQDGHEHERNSIKMNALILLIK